MGPPRVGWSLVLGRTTPNPVSSCLLARPTSGASVSEFIMLIEHDHSIHYYNSHSVDSVVCASVSGLWGSVVQPTAPVPLPVPLCCKLMNLLFLYVSARNEWCAIVRAPRRAGLTLEKGARTRGVSLCSKTGGQRCAPAIELMLPFKRSAPLGYARLWD